MVTPLKCFNCGALFSPIVIFWFGLFFKFNAMFCPSAATGAQLNFLEGTILIIDESNWLNFYSLIGQS